VQRDYFSALLSVQRELETVVRELILPGLESITKDQRSRLGLTVDAPDDDMERLLEQAREGFAVRVPENEFTRIAETAENAAQNVNKEQVQGQLQAAGRPLFTDTTGLNALQRGFVKANTKLIKDSPAKAFQDIEGILSRGLAKGDRHGTIAKEITQRLEVTKSRARLIARDHVSKHNAQLTRQRHLANGITHSIWRTVGDERVRPEHEDRDGKRFSNTTGIEGEFPGEPINCRCFAEPIVNPEQVAA
jgi:SPP1 gp7 family putative phage head morphogenesis protein